MKVIIAGSRSITNPKYIQEAISAAYAQMNIEITEVVSGTALGVDRIGEEWAKRHYIPIKPFPAKWNIKVGDKVIKDKTAGFKRNFQMAQYGDALIAVWDGSSNGTANMINTMKDLGKPVFVYKVKNENPNQ